MAFIPTPGAVRIVINGATDRAPVVNVLHAGVAVEPSGVAMQAWAQAAYDAWEANILGFLSSTYRLQAVAVYDLSAQDGLVGTHSEASPAGGASGPALPFDSAACITLRSANRGRSARGRVYLGPIAENSADNGVLAEAVAANLFDAFGAFRSDLGLAGLFLSIVSYQTNKNKRAQGAIFPVVGHELRSRILASQARRSARP